MEQDVYETGSSQSLVGNKQKLVPTSRAGAQLEAWCPGNSYADDTLLPAGLRLGCG